MWTLARPAEWSQEIKKSRFLARAAAVESVAAAETFLAVSADTAARHNCWAYRIGTTYRWFDADEPAGTAGRPILAAIDGQRLDRVAVLVTRWFGGIKLGAGGLVRAYGGTAAECLRRAERSELIEQRELAFRIGFASIGSVHALIDQFGAAKLAETFDGEGARLRIAIATSACADFSSALRDATRGSAILLDDAP
jgi:uncharacterized YigZ family protein